MISLIIPAFNEERYLPNLLNSVQVARKNYAGEKNELEVIVADNNSTDGTVAIAQRHGYVVTHEKKRIIAAVRNNGAAQAHGEIIAFTDADNQIHPHTFGAIDKALQNQRIIAGSTGVRLERYSLGIALTYALIVPLVWATRFDSGVVFCRRSDFRAVFGYNENHLYAEDVRLLYDLWRLGRSKGQRLIRLRRYKAITSTRKFDHFGEWHYFNIIVRFLAGMILPGYSFDHWARRYWYDDHR